MIRQQQTGEALGSDISLTVIVPDEQSGKDILKVLWSQIQAFDQQFSRFIDDNDLAQFNAHSGDMNEISLSFQALLEASKHYMADTDGLFSPFVLPILQREGYVGSWPTPEVFNYSLDYRDRNKVATADDLIVEPGEAKIPFDTAVEFGGIGKGYLLDELSALLETKHVKNYWLSLGGDIVCAGFDLEDKPWKIGIAGAKDDNMIVASALNKTGQKLALATSGINKRTGEDWNHIIDPRTGKSSKTDVATATVALPSATAADVYATCLILVGSEKAVEFTKKFGITHYLLQLWNNETMTVEKLGDELWD